MIFQNLKKLTFGLAALLFLAFSFTACTTNEDNELHPSAEKFSIESGLALPAAVFNQGAAAVDAHLSNADEVTIATYHNNYIVGQYLVEYGKMTDAMATLNADDNIIDLDLSKYLSAAQIQQIDSQLASASLSNIERGCVPTYHWYDVCQCWGPGAPFCW